MNNSQLSKFYKITELSPLSINKEIVSVNDFVRESYSFLMENFNGLFEIKFDITACEHIRIPLDQIISFFKVLALNIRAKSLVFVNYSCNNSGFSIEACAKGGLPLDKAEMRKLTIFAKSAGFTVKKTAQGLLLTTAVIPESSLSVFASVIVARNLIRERFYRIFFEEKE